MIRIYAYIIATLIFIALFIAFTWVGFLLYRELYATLRESFPEVIVFLGGKFKEGVEAWKKRKENK